MEQNSIKIKAAVLHEATFIVGVGTLGPNLGPGGNNTASIQAQLQVKGPFLELTSGSHARLIPLSNVKSLTPA